MLLDFLFPNRCLQCNRIIGADAVVCDGCFDQITFTHWPYGSENELTEKCRLLFPVENAYAMMRFEDGNLAQQILHELKYKGREKIGKIVADWISERIEFGNNRPDLIVTIPMHPKKQEERGYNQLHLFGDEISRNFDVPVDHFLLKKNHHKKAQALKGKNQRTKTEKMYSLQKDIQNKHVLIVDDVFTTGSTMATVAWEILKSGNNRVSIMVMAMD